MDDALNFVIAADDRIDLALLRLFDQVCRKVIKHGSLTLSLRLLALQTLRLAGHPLLHAGSRTLQSLKEALERILKVLILLFELIDLPEHFLDVEVQVLRIHLHVLQQKNRRITLAGKKGIEKVLRSDVRMAEL